jgi:hypothetical protein
MRHLPSGFLEDLSEERVPGVKLDFGNITGGNAVFKRLGQGDGKGRGGSKGSDEDTGRDLDHC